MPNDDSMDISGGGGDGKFHFAIDRGGTFTDVVCRLPEGREVVFKLLRRIHLITKMLRRKVFVDYCKSTTRRLVASSILVVSR